jgi:DNA modification methylase
VIHGDCRSITPMIPDKAIDAIITDPGWDSIGDQLKTVNNFAGAQSCEEQQ